MASTWASLCFLHIFSSVVNVWSIGGWMKGRQWRLQLSSAAECSSCMDAVKLGSNSFKFWLCEWKLFFFLFLQHLCWFFVVVCFDYLFCSKQYTDWAKFAEIPMCMCACKCVWVLMCMHKRESVSVLGGGGYKYSFQMGWMNYHTISNTGVFDKLASTKFVQVFLIWWKFSQKTHYVSSLLHACGLGT